MFNFLKKCKNRVITGDLIPNQSSMTFRRWPLKKLLNLEAF